MEIKMDNSRDFVVMIDKLNILIANLNIKISKNPENTNLKKFLNDVINDRELLYKGSKSDLEKIIAKYGEKCSE